MGKSKEGKWAKGKVLLMVDEFLPRYLINFKHLCHLGQKETNSANC